MPQRRKKTDEQGRSSLQILTSSITAMQKRENVARELFATLHLRDFAFHSGDFSAKTLPQSGKNGRANSSWQGAVNHHHRTL